MRICLCQFLVFLPDTPEEVWSGGRDLNLRRSGFCTLDRLNDAHHTGRLLQHLRQPRHLLGWLGSSTKLSYRPTDLYNVKITIYAFRYLNSKNSIDALNFHLLYDQFCELFTLRKLFFKDRPSNASNLY